jgi:adenine-specific DNA-methyltransferase
MSKQKLELTWIGKDKQPVLEPLILIEDPEKSYGDKTTENMLIFGDNLPDHDQALLQPCPFINIL